MSTALHVCAGAESTKILVEARANVNTSDKSGQTALFLAARMGDIDMAKILVGAGMNANIKDQEGRTALFTAAEFASLEMVQYLVEEASADASLQNKQKLTAWQVAKSLPDSNGARQDVLNFLARECKRPKKRRRYCIVFDDPTDPNGQQKIPFGTKEYEQALQKLSDACPEMQLSNWDANAPWTQGPAR